MVTHLLVRMVAPLLMVRAAPITLALRALSVVPARRLSRLLRSPFARVVTHPVVAGSINLAGLCVIYLTPLATLMQHSPTVHLLVTAHVFVAGYLLTASLVPVDPTPHRAGFAVRAGVLVVGAAGHGILAKHLYAAPMVGYPVVDVERGAQLMYVGGDAVELALALLPCAEWYRRTRHRSPAMRGERISMTAPLPRPVTTPAAHTTDGTEESP